MTSEGLLDLLQTVKQWYGMPRLCFVLAMFNIGSRHMKRCCYNLMSTGKGFDVAEDSDISFVITTSLDIPTYLQTYNLTVIHLLMITICHE